MNTLRARLSLPTSLALTFASGAALSACTQPNPARDAASDEANPATDAQPPADAMIVISDACSLTQCVGGPIPLCAPDDGSVLSCPQPNNCTAALTLDGGLIGTQCYGSCVTSTVADGATLTGFC